MHNEVLKYLSETTGVTPSSIKISHRIEEDFGLSGLDIITFYEGFFEKFQIKNPEDFNLSKHTSPEGLLNFRQIVKSMFSEKARKELITEDVTVEHLIKVAERKKWIDFNS